jgi:hypothetical protein
MAKKGGDSWSNSFKIIVSDSCLTFQRLFVASAASLQNKI